MLTFHPITLDAVRGMAPCLAERGGRMCDFTPLNLYIWRDYYYTGYAEQDGWIYLRLRLDNGRAAYAVPLGGGDLNRALDRLKEHSVLTESPLIFSLVREDQLPLLAAWAGRSPAAEYSRDWCDYLYDAAPMAAYSGHRYGKQRNHVRHFEATYPGWRMETLEERHLPVIRAFLRRFIADRRKQGAIAEEEVKRTCEALPLIEPLGLFGVVLYVGEEMIGFSAGSVVGDTLFVHFEKALTSFEGAYQMLVRGFARSYVTASVTTINREEDCGDAGLRQSKLSYHPRELLKKYTVTF